MYKNTLAYYGTGGTGTVGMNYLVSSCSDDPEESVTFVSVGDRNLWKMWGKNNTLLHHLTL